MDYMKQIWMDKGLKEHTYYIFGDVIMEIVKDKMPKARSEAVCLTWGLRNKKCRLNMLLS